MSSEVEPDHLKKPRTYTQMKFYKVVAGPTLLYGSKHG
jgi:hypothetical protein